jgi:tetratricopeptide (TPR) repeat protein
MPSESDLRQRAVECFQKAYEHQMHGEFDEAIALYTQSIEAYPTAEAYTFRGWTYSCLGNYERAIAECLEAIKVDRDFGNPYNDIGAYLIEQGKWDEAIPWFEKAIRAPRYDARCYPQFNLGRVYEHKREWRKAKACYASAIELNRQYRLAWAALRRLQAMWN